MSTTPTKRRAPRIIAGLSVAAILAASGATFSLWQDTTDLATARTFTGGTLTIETASAGQWVDATTGEAVPAGRTLQPGDHFTYTEQVIPTLTGDLAADLTVGEVGISSEGDALISAVEVTRTVTMDGQTHDGPVRLTAEDTGTPVAVQVDLQLPIDAETGMGEVIVLSDVPVVLDQVTE